MRAASRSEPPVVRRRRRQVATVRDDSKLAFDLVGLERTQQHASNLGGFTKAQRQQARRQGIKTSGVAALGSGVNLPRPLQGLVGAQTGGLVEQQQAVHIAPVDA